MNKETLSVTPENEPTDNQWEDPEIPKNMEDMPLRIDLKSPEWQAKFAKAEIMAKKGTINAEQVTEDGLANGSYADKDVFQTTIYLDPRSDKQGEKIIQEDVDRLVQDGVLAQDDFQKVGEGYALATYTMVGEGPERKRQWETNHILEPGDWIATKPKKYPEDYDNNYIIKDKKFGKLYEPSDQEGVYKAKGLAKIIPNDTGRIVEIEKPASWGGGFMEGAQDCFFRYSCDADGNIEGNPAILSADAVETTWGSLAEVRPDLVQDNKESEPKNSLHPTAERFMRATVWGEKHIYDNTFGNAVQEELGTGTLNIPRENPEKTLDYFHQDVMNGLVPIDEATWFLECTNGVPHMDNERAVNTMDQIDDLNSERGKTDSDVQHERRILGYLLDGDGRGSQNPDRWHHPENVDSDAIPAIVAKYKTVLDFRKAEIQLIQGLGVGSENYAENEEKREEYRRAGRELERIIYGEKEVARANGIMDAFAEAGIAEETHTIAKVNSRDTDKYLIRDNIYGDSGQPVVKRQLFQYDSNLRLRPEYSDLG